jgi:cytochrome c-type biogenesis protein CcmF
VLVGATALLVSRLPLLRSAHTLESYVSREAVFLVNNLLLVGLAFAVFWGTMFPILSEAARGQRITVGQGYYDQVALPIGAALLVLTGVGPLIAWRKASPAQLRRRFAAPLGLAGAAAAPLLLLTDLARSWTAALVVVAGVFVVACIGGEVWRGLRVRHALGGVSWPGALVSMVARNRRRYGGYAVHLGIVVLFVGLAGSRGFASEADVALPARGQAEVAGYTLVNEGATRARSAHKMSVSVRVGVFRDGRRVATMTPGIDRFAVDGTRSSDVAIDSGPARDLYLVLTQLREDGIARVSVFVNPLVLWLWVAGAIIGLGGLLAAWPGPPAPRREPAASPAAEGGGSAASAG